MQKRLIVILATILFLLALVVGAELYWLKKLEKQEAEAENTTGASKNSTACEFAGKTYQPAELFLVRLSSGCSLCHCGGDGRPVCEKTYCPEEAPDE